MIGWLKAIGFALTLRCEQAEELRDRCCRGRATRAQRFAERFHRLMCRSCRWARAQAESLDAALKDLREHGSPPPDTAESRLPTEARDRIRAELLARTNSRE